MKHLNFLSCGFALYQLLTTFGFAQSTAFTYQGRLNDGANPANGGYDLTFTLFGTSSGGTAIAGPVTNTAPGVSNGLFTVTLDFGNQFPGTARWLEIGVRTNGSGAFATLSPRQPLTSTPYAIQSANAASAASASSVAAGNVTGTLATAQIPNLDASKITSGTLAIARLPVNVALLTGGNTFNGNQIVTNGSVGIGTNNPGLNTVQINPTFEYANGYGLVVCRSDYGANVQISRTNGQGGIGLVVDDAANGDASTSLLLVRNNVTNNPNTALFDVLASGNVGIGTTTPGTALQVNGTVTATAFVGDGSGLTNLPFSSLARNGVLAWDGVLAWGYNGEGETTVPAAAQRGVVAIAAGSYHTVALKNDGSVVAWGDNSFGQTTVPAAAQSGVVAIAGGYAHTVALKNDGSVLAWGYNPSGQTTVPAAAQSGVVAIAAGGDVTVALKNGGTVLAWGDPSYGQTTVPAAAQSGVVAIAAGFHHTVALKNDGSVLAWGDNTYGQTTVPAVAQSGVVAIAAGGYHTVALKSDGSVLAWGDNTYGQTTVPTAAQSGVVAIAGGDKFTVALAPLLNASQLTTDTVPDARLSANVALRNAVNTFSGNQIINGNVGIGTATPTKGSLEIDAQNGTQPGYAQEGYLSTGGAGTGSIGAGGGVSIWAAGTVFASGYFAVSDARVKNVLARSDSAADLKTLLGIKVTDFTYKDTIAKGNAPQKKVIAQQVEQLYPQAVSKSTDVVPDIYRKATLKDGWVQLATNLKVGDRVKLIGDKEKGVYPVLGIRDGAFRTDFKPSTEQVFVYGREVNDFRNVDYEAIAMLNVSATQELAHQLKAQQEELSEVQAEKQALLKRLSVLEARDQAREERLARMESALDKGSDGASYVSLKRP